MNRDDRYAEASRHESNKIMLNVLGSYVTTEHRYGGPERLRAYR